MITPARRAFAAVPLAGLGLLILTGCGLATDVTNGPVNPMMGGVGRASTATGSGSSHAPVNGGSMMGGRSMMGSTATCAAPGNLAGSVVDVRLADMGMMTSGVDPAPLGIPMRLRTSTTNVPAGQISFVATNVGTRTHELVILPLATGQQAGALTPDADGKVSENGSLGEASAACASGAGDGITLGTTGWVTLTLAPGRYELVCNEPNHYADGMTAELDVT